MAKALPCLGLRLQRSPVGEPQPGRTPLVGDQLPLVSLHQRPRRDQLLRLPLPLHPIASFRFGGAKPLPQESAENSGRRHIRAAARRGFGQQAGGAPGSLGLIADSHRACGTSGQLTENPALSPVSSWRARPDSRDDCGPWRTAFTTTANPTGPHRGSPKPHGGRRDQLHHASLGGPVSGSAGSASCPLDAAGGTRGGCPVQRRSPPCSPPGFHPGSVRGWTRRGTGAA